MTPRFVGPEALQPGGGTAMPGGAGMGMAPMTRMPKMVAGEECPACAQGQGMCACPPGERVVPPGPRYVKGALLNAPLVGAPNPHAESRMQFQLEGLPSIPTMGAGGGLGGLGGLLGPGFREALGGLPGITGFLTQPPRPTLTTVPDETVTTIITSNGPMLTVTRPPARPTVVQEKPKNICGPDVTEWFYEDLKKHIEWAEKVKKEALTTATRTVGFRDQAANLMAYKWMDFGEEWGDCATGECRSTVEIGGVCVRKNVLGNIAFQVIGTLFPPGSSVAGEFDTPEKVAAEGKKAGGRWPSGRERRDNIGAFGVGTALAEVWHRIKNFEDFRQAIRQYLRSEDVLNKWSKLLTDVDPKSDKITPRDLAWIEDSATPGGFDTRRCDPCPSKWGPKSTSSIEWGEHLKREFSRRGAPGDDFEKWRKTYFENYYGPKVKPPP